MIRSYILIIIILFIHSNSITACDICGCSVQGSFMGIFPQNHNNMVGYRSIFRSSIHPQTALNQNGTSQVNEDHFFRQELWIRYFLRSKVQVFGHVPYQLNQRFESKRTTTLQGVGDIQASINYTIWNTAGQIGKKWENTLIAGLGVRLPTGKYQQRDETRVMLPVGFQAGNGAFGYVFQANHTLRRRKIGLNTNLQYWINTKNELDFKPGNQFLGALSAFYWHQNQASILLPHLGVSFEQFGRDQEYGFDKSYTGGTSMFLSFGTDIYYKQVLVQLLSQFPLQQQLTSSQPEDRVRLSLGVSLFF